MYDLIAKYHTTNMKNKTSTLIIAAGFTFLSLMANASVLPETTYKTSSGKIIHSNFKIPSNLGIKNQKIEILFSTDDKGQVNFVTC